MIDFPSSTGVSSEYQDHDLVYVDPETRVVVGRVEWGKNDQPVSLTYGSRSVPQDAKKEKSPQFWRKLYPWGTFRSMKKIYKLQGKVKDPEPNKTLDEVLPKALHEAFWDWNAS